MLGLEFRVVDMTRDEAPDNCRHSICREIVINAAFDLGEGGVETYTVYRERRHSF